MNTFEMLIMLVCVTQTDFTQGLQKIFPDKEAHQKLESHTVQNSGGDIKWSLGNDRLSLLKHCLLTVTEILKETHLTRGHSSHINKKQRKPSQSGHLKGVTIPSVKDKLNRKDGNGTNLIHILLYRRNSLDKKQTQPSLRNLQGQSLKQSVNSRSSKRNSAITPPSREWCRLIGYRVCPRAMAAGT